MLEDRIVQDSLLLAPQAMTNSATVTANFDTLGADYATIRVAFATELNTNAVGPTLSLLQSDDTVATNFATVVANRTAEDLTSAKEVTYGIDMRGKKRYLRLSVSTATATNDNVTVSAIGTLSRMSEGPAGTTDAGDVVVYA
jgi:hypothetical protein